MKLELNRLDSETCIRASTEAYKKAFPLPDKLSGKNLVVDIYLDTYDTPDSIFSLLYLIAQSHVALAVVHLVGVKSNGILTARGEAIVKNLQEGFEKHNYAYIGATSVPSIILWGMLHPGLVYTE